MKMTLRHKILSVMACSLAVIPASGTPTVPGNLNAAVNGLIVDLTWDWGNQAAATLFEDFEDDTFPPAGWDIERGYQFGDIGNWMLYSFDPEDEETLAHSGYSTAMVMMADDYDEQDPTTMHQDEWLIVKPGIGAEYMEFWYFLYPDLLEFGAYMDFPDHYYVKISRDNGDTWTELWDGRWDMGDTDQVQPAALFLGEPCDDDTLVAFQAVSGEEESLYFLWTIDDVVFYTASEAAATRPALSMRKPHPLPKHVRTHRPFTHTDTARKMARIPKDEWLNAGQTTYRVYLDDQIVGDYIKKLSFTDYSNKTPGTHTYRVMAWNEATDTEYPATEINVEIESFEFLPPVNVKAYWEKRDDGKYAIEVGWDSPDSALQPAYFNVYVNGKGIGRLDIDEYPYALGQYGLPKGAYALGVEAVYEHPEGTSPIVEAYVFPGTCVTPIALQVSSPDGGTNLLRWEMPELSEPYEAPAGWTVYRGETLIATVSDKMEYTDTDAPANGTYLYSVHALYTDNAMSLPATALIDTGNHEVATLPLSQTFDNCHLPANWNVELNDPYLRVKDIYAWRFDNWFDLSPDPASGITGGFASISCPDAGYNLLESYLISPEFKIPADMPVSLQFDRWYSELEVGPSGPALAEVQISTDGASTWQTLADLNTTDTGRIDIPLTDYAGHDAIIRWGVIGRASGTLAIDNVSISRSDDNAVSQLTAISATTVNVYTASGVLLHKDLPATGIGSLPKGLYLITGTCGMQKIMIQ
ncbi:MAG: hypothetical protein K2H21_02230 [Muribaculaceae bacterium]|nr:hypothetical protein [Muribaculaceae bacterium]